MRGVPGQQRWHTNSRPSPARTHQMRVPALMVALRATTTMPERMK